MSDDAAEKEDTKYVVPTEYGLEVYRTVGNRIGIKQDDPFASPGEEPVVVVSPERVDQLIAFLRAVKDEILTDRADEAEAASTDIPPPPING